ncbi:MAG: OmpH family outer membrane protein [Deltaproteobacteria bacterium]|nr:OmpH family outer membrane protein [Deltaproteobacteria bacterium]
MDERSARTSPSFARRAAHVAAALALAVTAPKLYAQARLIAVVDLQRAAAETNEGRNVLGALKVQVDRRQAELAPRAEKISNLKKRLETPGRTPPATLQRLYQQYVAQVQEFQGLSQRYTEELQTQQQQAVQVILTKMTPVMRELAQTQGYQIIVDATAVHYVPMQLNLTDHAIELYNRQNPAVLTNPDAGVAPGATLTGPNAGVNLNAATQSQNTTAIQQTGATPPAATPPPANTGAPGLTGVFYRRDAGR